MAKFTPEQIEAALQAKSERLGGDDLRRIAGARQAVTKMTGEFPPPYALAKKQALLLFDTIESSSTGKVKILPEDLKYAAGALIYLGEALDIVPDDEEDGFADDAAVVALAIEKSKEALLTYCSAMGLKLDDYLA